MNWAAFAAGMLVGALMAIALVILVPWALESFFDWYDERKLK